MGLVTFLFQSINCLAAWKNPENDTPGSGFLGGFTGKTSKMIPWKLTFFSDPLIVWALQKPGNPECVVGNFFFRSNNCFGGSKDGKS